MDTDRHSADTQSMARPAGDRRRIAAYAAIAALLGLLLYPVAGWLVRSWLANPYYSHGFLIPPMAVFFAWRRWPHMAREPRKGETWPGLALAMAGLAAVVWATQWRNHVVAALAVVPLLAGILLFLEGRARLRPWLFPLLFMALMVPLPIVDRLAPWMEAFTAHGAATVAHVLGLQVVQQGGEISIPGTAIVVGAPCSGLRSLVTIVTIGVAWAYIVEGRLLARLGLLAALLPLTAAANVVRIAGLLVVAARLGEEVALSYYHDWSGIVLFGLVLGAMLLLGKVLGCGRIRDDIW